MARPHHLQATGENIRQRAFEFACNVVKFCDDLYQQPGVGRVMAPQLVRCATSVAGMLEEAKAAESKRDFLSKGSIALKEARESHVRLRIHEACGIGIVEKARGLRREAGELAAIIAAILRNTRQHMIE